MMDSTLDSTAHLKSSYCVSTSESLPSLASSPMPPSLASLRKVTLKRPLDSLKYEFLGPNDTLTVMITFFYFVINRNSVTPS